MNLFSDEAPKSDEARKMCERAEHYMAQLRNRELRFNKEAQSITFPLKDGRKAVLDVYVTQYMTDYDKTKVEEAEYEIKLKSVYSKDDVFSWRENRELYQRTLNSIQHSRYLIACNFLEPIDLAISKNVLEEGETFFHRLEECEAEKKKTIDERDTLEKELDELSAKYIGLQALYDDCQRKLHIKPLGTKDT